MRKNVLDFKKMGKSVICLILALSILFSLPITASAAPTSKGSAQTLAVGNDVQSHLDGLGTTHWYKITPNANQYYRFTIYNQSIEVRTGISFADNTLNLFLGKINVTIYDSYDAVMAEGSVKCGYTGSVSLKLTQNHTYYLKVSSTIAGNYRIKTAAFADIGADSWNGAEDALSNGQLISSVDADSDKDWFKFVADSERSYYNFQLENISGSSYMYFKLYEYVPGAGETPLRHIFEYDVYKGNTKSRDTQLKEGVTYYYCISGSKGGYQLNVSQTLDVAGPDYDTAYNIDLEKQYTTSFDGTDDNDYYKFTTDSDNAYYHFNYESLSVNERRHIWLYDADGNEIFYNDPYGVNSKDYNKLLKPDSTYYLRLRGSNGNYSFGITKKSDTYYDDIERATEVELSTVYSTSFDGTDDVDYVKFTTDSDNAYYHINYKSLSVNERRYIWLYDADGNQILYNDPYGVGSNNYNKLLKPDSTYYLRLKGSNGNYEFSITKKSDEYYNEKENSTQIELSTVYTTSFEGTDDRDYVKFTTDSDNAYYHINYKSLSVTERAYIWLNDADGNEVLYDDPYGICNNNYTRLLKPDSTYYILFKGSGGNYEFSITKKSDIYYDVKDKATQIELSTVYTTAFEGTDDRDYVKFTTDSDNAYYHINYESLSVNERRYIWLTDTDGNDILYNDPYGQSNNNYNKLLKPNSTYYILFKGSGGNYKFSITKKSDAYYNEKEKAANVELSTNYSTAFEGSDDIDYVKFNTISKDAYYYINYTSLSVGERRYIWVYDADGNEILYNDPYGANSKDYSVSLKPDSTYYILFKGSNGNYTFNIKYECDYEGNTKDEAVEVNLNKLNECKLESNSDVDWFKFTVDYDDDYRFRVINETSGNIYADLYNSREGLVKGVSASGENDYTVTLTAGTYYLRIKRNYGDPKYYTWVVAECGNGHFEKTTYSTKAGINKYGTKKTVCSKCGKVIKTEKVSAIKSISIVSSTLTYTGGRVIPKFTVTDMDGKKITSYSVSYSNSASKAIGKYTATVTLSGAYSGTKSFTYKIVPATPKVKAVGTTAGNSLSWNKVSGAKGYTVYYRYYSGSKWSSWKKIKSTTSRSYTHKATSGYLCQYKVEAYSGSYISGTKATSSVVRLACPKVTAKKSGSSIKASWNKIKGAKGYIVYRRQYNSRTRKWSSYKKVKTTTARSFIDRGTKRGTYYQYAVKAYNTSASNSTYKPSKKVKR